MQIFIKQSTKSVIHRLIAFGLVIMLTLPMMAVFAAVSEYIGEPNTITSDTSGNNLVGNTPEQRILGGFYAEQGKWLFYADAENGGILCAITSGMKEGIALTDFAVANLNVMGDTLVFTDISATVGRGYRLEKNKPENLAVAYGGKLYAADGVLNLMKGGKLGSIKNLGGSGQVFYNVSLTQSGIYALCGPEDSKNPGKDWEYVRVNDDETETILFLSGSETPVVAVDMGETEFGSDTVYIETNRGEQWGRILRFDREREQIIDYIEGRLLSCYGERIFFLSNTNHYLYELVKGSKSPQVMSACQIYFYQLLDNGDINAVGADMQSKVLISLYGDYKGFSLVKKVGDWYNYFNKAQKPVGAKKSEPFYNKTTVESPVEPPKEPTKDGDNRPNTPAGNTDPKPNGPSGDTGTKPTQTPEPKPQKGIVTPDLAVEMVLNMIKLGDINDSIYDVYDTEAKQVFLEHYINMYGNNFELRKACINILEQQMKKLPELPPNVDASPFIYKVIDLFNRFMRSAQYTLTTTSQNETEAFVTAHITRDINFRDFSIGDTSVYAARKSLINYITSKGLTAADLDNMTDQQKMDMMIDSTIHHLEKPLRVFDTDWSCVVRLEAHPVLGWVIDIKAKETLYKIFESDGGGNEGIPLGDGDGDGDDADGDNSGNEPDDSDKPDEKPGDKPDDDLDRDEDLPPGGDAKLGDKDEVPEWSCTVIVYVKERKEESFPGWLWRSAKNGAMGVLGFSPTPYTPSEKYGTVYHLPPGLFPGMNACGQSIELISYEMEKSLWEKTKSFFKWD